MKKINEIEEIRFSDSLTIWKSRYEIKDKKKCVIDVRNYIKMWIENVDASVLDAYNYFISGEFKNLFYKKFTIKNELDEIVLSSINTVIDLHKKIYNKDYNKIYTNNWINIVKIKPQQSIWSKQNNLVFHKHTDLNNLLGLMEPDFTYVTYIQMPNNLSDNDGVLYMRDSEGKIFHYLPEEGDIIIMKGEIDHVPNHASQSTVDRIVMAGNVTLVNDKTIKTLL